MSQNAVAGHGATIAIEIGSSPNYTPVGGTFTDVGELNGDINWPSLSLPETNVTAHNDTIDFWITGVLQREPVTFTINYVYSDTMHQALLNIVSKRPAVRRGIRLRGPSGSANTDEIIASGFVTNVGPIVHPVREGARTAQVTVRLTGAMKIDGTAYPS